MEIVLIEKSKHKKLYISGIQILTEHLYQYFPYLFHIKTMEYFQID